ncbi:microfibril-associated glycoprotein 4-like isoform X1 [Clavelina lepadiformis]|uniref:microfibril-associated glycoprotein 4-like isoform X1 n=1 Tax=Clavelina lepadiformis TaxID=159417 RepID=UPI00404216CB
MEMRTVNEQEEIYEDTTAAPQISRRSDIKRENGQTKCRIAAKFFTAITIAVVAILAIVNYVKIQQLLDESSQLREGLAISQLQLTEAIGNVSESLANSQQKQSEAIGIISESLANSQQRQTETIGIISESLANSQQKQTEAIGIISESLANSQRQQYEAIGNISDRIIELGQKLNNTIRQLTGEVAIAKSFQGEDCKAVFNNGITTSGIYTINVGGKATQVYCDMETDGGGWTVFQRRFDGGVDFYRNWISYQQGFGSLNGEFWLGLDLLHQLTAGASYKLRVDLEDAENNTAYAEYKTFTVGPESSNYTLTVGRYSGTAGDSLADNSHDQFSTFDRDHDWSGMNCAVGRHGGWWYYACSMSNLNGEYLTPGESDSRGLIWFRWKNNYESMRKTEMKIKPV